MVSQIPQFGFNYGRYNTSFGALDATQQNPSPQMPAMQSGAQTDTFQKTNNTQTNPLQNLTKNQKIGLGAGAALALGGLVYVLTRGKAGSNSVKQLAEHIDFKPAQTMEEAVKFAKENLGVKLKLGDNLTVANFVNERLVNVNNKMKGKSVMPDKVVIDLKHKSADGLETEAAMTYGHNAKKRVLTLGKPFIEAFEICNKKGMTMQQAAAYVQKYNHLSRGNAEEFLRTIYHELGHANHFAQCKNADKMLRLTELKKANIDTHITEEFLKDVKDNKEVRKFMSENSIYCEELKEVYPLTSPAEFVADVFAFKIMGIKIPAKVEKIYQKYGGPAVIA